MIALQPDRDVLIAIDIQLDFCPGGALAVADGDAVVAPTNRLLGKFAHAVATQDWHPAGHSSFAVAHPDRKVFQTVPMPYGPQTLWPEHCVQGTAGAEFHADLDVSRFELVIRKGYRAAIDSYSAFYENDKTTPTGLAGYLRERGFQRVVLTGLATDFCVAYSALDAVHLGFETVVVLDACRAIDLGGTLDAARRAWAEAGVIVATSGDF